MKVKKDAPIQNSNSDANAMDRWDAMRMGTVAFSRR
jgi:hypothetical protein